jgi:predicted small metal-binding protein
MKEIHCGEFISGCPHVSRGRTEEELLASVAEHAREAHGMTEIGDDLKAQLLQAIKER